MAKANTGPMPTQTDAFGLPSSHLQRCEYTSKRCENPRAIKPNGERHRLCDHHRRLANNNQRRWQNRKKLLQRGEQAHADALVHLRTAIRITASSSSSQNSAWVRPYPYPYPHAVHGARSPQLDASPEPSLREEPRPLLPRLRQHHVLRRALSLPPTLHQQKRSPPTGLGPETTLRTLRFGERQEDNQKYERSVHLSASARW